MEGSSGEMTRQSLESLDPATSAVLRAAIHDLKGPASRLRVLAQLLQKNSHQLDDDSRTLVGHIADSTVALDVVIGGLRNYAELCVRDPRLEVTDLAAVLEKATAGWKRQPGAREVEIASDLAPGTVMVPADPRQLEWLFSELLANALRFRGPDPLRIQIAAEQQTGGGWTVTFVDNGAGIEAHLAERAFRPFQTLSRSGGAGMGLTICRKIVETHGGRMWIEPRAAGAELRFTLPGPPHGENSA
jgi:signal transduction histidine kinase